MVGSPTMRTEKQTKKALEELSRLSWERLNLATVISELVVSLRAPDAQGRCDAAWQDIADALGIAKSSAVERFGKLP
jgi:hypothetical protein